MLNEIEDLFVESNFGESIEAAARSRQNWLRHCSWKNDAESEQLTLFGRQIFQLIEKTCIVGKTNIELFAYLLGAEY